MKMNFCEIFTMHSINLFRQKKTNNQEEDVGFVNYIFVNYPITKKKFSTKRSSSIIYKRKVDLGVLKNFLILKIFFERTSKIFKATSNQKKKFPNSFEVGFF